MAETDDATKTEEPTERRLDEGRRKGQVAVSQEVKSAAMLLAAAAAVVVVAPPLMRHLARTGRTFIESPDAFRPTADNLQAGLWTLLADVGLAAAPLAVLLMVVAAGAALAQSGLIWAPEKIAPDLEKISPLKGAKRLFSMRTMVEFVKGVAKLCVVAAIAGGLAMPLLANMELLVSTDVLGGLVTVEAVTVRMTAAAAAVMTVIAALDYWYQRHAFMKQMRMTKQEVRDEHKQSDGDPHVKARIRKLRAERAQRRMMANVPKADVVVTNPTHYAVALEYKMENMSAPRVVAKGVDHLARRIREVAAEHDVPRVENPPLARALYATVELDEMIPPEHYQAVAQVISYVMKLKGGMP